MKQFEFFLKDERVYKCIAEDLNDAWLIFSERKQLTVEYLKEHYNIKPI